MGPEAESGTITCPHCRRKFPFKTELEGKRIRCKCGSVFEAALDLESDLPDSHNTYDLAPGGEGSPRVAPLATPGTSIAGIDGSTSSGNTRVLTYAHARPAEVEQRRLKSPFRELYLPIGLLLLGVGFRAGQVVLDTGGPAGGVGGAIGAAIVGVILNIGLTMAAVFVSAKVLSVDFGPISELVLKITAVAVLGGAVGAFIVSLSPKDMTGPIVALHVLVVLYWIMFYSFFEIDVQESLMTVAIVTMFHIAAFCILFKPMGK